MCSDCRCSFSPTPRTCFSSGILISPVRIGPSWKYRAERGSKLKLSAPDRTHRTERGRGLRELCSLRMRGLLRDVMSRDLLTVAPEDTLGEAAEKMTGRGVGAALVMDFGRLVGILTERDLLAAVAGRVQASEARVREWMTEDPVTVPEATPIGKAASIMVTHGFRHLPIVEGERTIGIVSLRDVVRSVVRAYPEYENDAEGDGE